MIVKKFPFEVIQNAVSKTPKTLWKSSLWLVLQYLESGIFGNFGTERGGIFQFLDGNSRWRWVERITLINFLNLGTRVKNSQKK